MQIFYLIGKVVDIHPGYTKTRVPDKSKKKTMSYHIQFESNMTLTGSNADDRVPAKPSE